MLLTLRAQYATTTPRAAADAVISALSPAAWYRNATEVTSAGGFASAWGDYTANGRDLLQATATNQPAYANGVFTFDGVDNWMAVSFALAQPFTVAVRANPITWTDLDRFFDGGTDGENRVYQSGVTPKILHRGNAVGALSAAGTPSLGTKHSLIFVFNGASGVMSIDGTESVSNAGTNNMTGFTLAAGGGGLGGSPANIAYYEVCIFPSALDAAQRADVKTALDLI